MEVQGEVSSTMIPSDYLIYAVGAETQTFGIPDVKEHACFMKKIRRNSSQVAGYWDQDRTHFSSTSTNAPVQITCSPLLLWSTCKHYKVISFPLVIVLPRLKTSIFDKCAIVGAKKIVKM